MDPKLTRLAIGLSCVALAGCGGRSEAPASPREISAADVPIPQAVEPSRPPGRARASGSGELAVGGGGASQGVGPDLPADPADDEEGSMVAGLATGAEPVVPVPYCPGRPTTKIAVGGNLDSQTTRLAALTPFEPGNPANSAHFSTTMIVEDTAARAQVLDLYFRREERSWSYHALATGFEVGGGVLEFDADGALRHVEVIQDLVLPSPGGMGVPISISFGTPRDDGGSGLDGFTELPDSSYISHQQEDGVEAAWGFSCRVPTDFPKASAAVASCGSHATRRLSVRANLYSNTDVAREPWDARRPEATASFGSYVGAVDQAGIPLGYSLYFRKDEQSEWSFHVLLASENPGHEFARGKLVFNPNGSLKSVAVVDPLHLPTLGAPADAVALNFGTPTDEGGSGVDGVTAFAAATAVSWQHSDGAALACRDDLVGPQGPYSYGPAYPVRQASFNARPSCAGAITTRVIPTFNLDPSLPVSDVAWNLADPINTASVSGNTVLYDAALHARKLELHFVHIAAKRWQCHITVGDAGVRTEAASLDMSFTPHGSPRAEADQVVSLRFPLLDGSPGPKVDVVFQHSGWQITSFPGASNGWFSLDGAPPLAPCGVSSN